MLDKVASRSLLDNYSTVAAANKRMNQSVSNSMLLNRRYRTATEEEDAMADDCDEYSNEETTDLMVVNLTGTFSVRKEQYRDERTDSHQVLGDRVMREDTEAENEFN